MRREFLKHYIASTNKMRMCPNQFSSPVAFHYSRVHEPTQLMKTHNLLSFILKLIYFNVNFFKLKFKIMKLWITRKTKVIY